MAQSAWPFMDQNSSEMSPEEQLMAKLQAQSQSPVTPIPTQEDNMQALMTSQAAPSMASIKGAAPLSGYAQVLKDYLDSGKERRKQSEAYRKKEELGISALEKQLEQFRNPANAQMNLQPLLAFADFMNEGKSNLAGTYKGPMSRDERLIMATKLEEALQNRRGALSQHGEQAAKDQQQAAKDLITIQTLLAKQNQGKTLTGPEVDKITEAQNAVDMVKGLKNVIDANEGLLGTGGAAKASDLTKLIAGTIGEIPILGEAVGAKDAGEKERQVQAQFNTAKQKIGLLMEKGVLRKEDEAKYEKILPNISDTPAVARSKQQTFEQYLQNDLQRHVKNLGRAGYDVSNFADIGNDASGFPGNLGMQSAGQQAPAAPAPQAAAPKAPKLPAEGSIVSDGKRKMIFKNGKWNPI